MKDQPYMPQCDLSKAMTPQEIARQRAEVMMAFADGAEIETRLRQEGRKWQPNHYPYWNWDNFDYRIAKQPKTAERIKELEQEIADLKASDAETVTLYYFMKEDGEVHIETDPNGFFHNDKLIKIETIPLD